MALCLLIVGTYLIKNGLQICKTVYYTNRPESVILIIYNFAIEI